MNLRFFFRVPGVISSTSLSKTPFFVKTEIQDMPKIKAAVPFILIDAPATKTMPTEETFL